jgi:hypothetical protein
MGSVPSKLLKLKKKKKELEPEMNYDDEVNNNLSLVYTIKVSVITVGILHRSIISFEGFVRNV